MEDTQQTAVDRKQVGIRFLYSILYIVVFEVLKTIVQVTVLFQYAYLLISGKYSQPLKEFSNRVSAYGYRIMRYVTLNENKRPFPFSDFPLEVEPPDDAVSFK